MRQNTSVRSSARAVLEVVSDVVMRSLGRLPAAACTNNPAGGHRLRRGLNTGPGTAGTMVPAWGAQPYATTSAERGTRHSTLRHQSLCTLSA
jgi:hypothetical protein